MAVNRLMGLSSGMDTDALVKSMTSTYQTKIDNVNRAQLSVKNKLEKWDEVNSSLYSLYSNTLTTSKLSSSFNAYKTTSSSKAVTVNSSTEGIHSLTVDSASQLGYVTGAKLSGVSENSNISSLGLSAGKYNFNGKELTLTEDDTIKSLATKLSQNGVNASFDNYNKRFYISSKQTGEEGDFRLAASNGSTTAELRNALGLASNKTVYLKDDGSYYSDSKMTQKIEDKNTIDDIRNGNRAVRILGKDAEITLDGVSYKSKDNNFNVNGMEITVNEPTDEKIKISSVKDTASVKENIKKLISDYNDTLETLTKAYNTSANNYKPLIDSERESMSEKQQEKWDAVVKDGALYRDSRLNSVINSMRNAFTKTINGDTGYKYGVSTNGYFAADKNARYSLKIDEDKLDKMLQEDEEGTIAYFSGLANNLYKAIDNQMGSSESSSRFKVYDDKALQSKYDSYSKTTYDMGEKLVKLEEKYYKQFSAMEQALSTLQSQQNYLASMFGG